MVFLIEIDERTFDAKDPDDLKELRRLQRELRQAAKGTRSVVTVPVGLSVRPIPGCVPAGRIELSERATPPSLIHIPALTPDTPRVDRSDA